MSKFLFLGVGVFTLFCFSGNAVSQSIWNSDGLPKSIVEKNGGKKRYAVYFDPFLVRSESEKIIAKKYKGSEFDREKWEEIFSEELEKYDFSPGRRVIAGRVLGGIGKSLLNKDIYFNTTVSAMILDLSDRDYEMLSNMKEVTLINEIKESVAGLSFPYSNYHSGGELVSWAKIAVNADDGMTTSNPFYFMDMPPGDLQNTSEYNINYFYSSSPSESTDSKYHSAAIAQIVGGEKEWFTGEGY